MLKQSTMFLKKSLDGVMLVAISVVHVDRNVGCKWLQVLTAVGEGESIVAALQEAVPEDVRGNMAAAVSGAVQARGLSFNLVGFGKSMPPPRLPAGLIESIKGKIAGGTKREFTPTTPHLPVDGPTSEGARDTNAIKSASSEKVDGEGHADPVTHNNESQKADNQGEDVIACTPITLVLHCLLISVQNSIMFFCLNERAFIINSVHLPSYLTMRIMLETHTLCSNVNRCG